MIRLFHISDLHFGAEDPAALDWFEQALHAAPPDAVIVTGDLTMRARTQEFEAAGQWLKGLECPITIEPGNHDLPYFNLLARFFQPYARYRTIERMMERPLDIAEVAIVPLKSTARFQWRLNWSKGLISRAGLNAAVTAAAAAPEDKLLLVATHHPLIEPGTRSTAQTRGGEAALRALAEAGARAVLSGHVHDPFDVTHETGSGPIRLIGAGTLSRRTRASHASFNELRVAQSELVTIVHHL